MPVATVGSPQTIALGAADALIVSCSAVDAVASVAGSTGFIGAPYELGRVVGETGRKFGPYGRAVSLIVSSLSGSITAEVSQPSRVGDGADALSTQQGAAAQGVVSPDGIRSPAASIARTYNLLTLGCKLDTRVFYGASVTNGSAVVNVSDASFNALRDEGKYLRVVAGNFSGVATGALRGRIVTVNSPTQVTLDTTAIATFTGAGCYGSDDTAPFLAGLAEAALTGGNLLVPAGIPNSEFTGLGILRPGSAIIIPDGVTLLGEGADYPRVQDPPANGSALFLHSFLGGGAFFQLGDGSGGGGGVASGNVRPRMYGIAVDAMRLAATVVTGQSRRPSVEQCTIWRGTFVGLETGPDADINCNKIGMQNEGTPLVVEGDSRVHGNVIRQGGSGGSQVRLVGQDISFSGNHLFAAGWNDTLVAGTACPNMIITNAASSEDGGLMNIVANIFDSTYGAHVVTSISGTRALNAITMIGNHFFSGTAVPANTFPVVDFAHGAGTSVLGFEFSHNTGNGGITNGTTYSAMMAKSGAGAVAGVGAENNKFSNCQVQFSGFLPDAGRANNWTQRGTGLAGTQYKSSNNGTATLNGTGAQTAFTIAHGLDAAPTDIVVTAGSANARGDYHVTADATNLTVTYATAPVSGTGNVVLYWRAGL